MHIRQISHSFHHIPGMEPHALFFWRIAIFVGLCTFVLHTSSGLADTPPASTPNAQTSSSSTTPSPSTAETWLRLSLVDTLKRLLQDNPLLARERLVIRQSEASLQIAKGAFGFDLELSLQLNEANQPLGYQNANGDQTGIVDVNRQRWGVDTSILINKRFELGTLLTVKFSQAWNWQDDISVYLDSQNSFNLQTQTLSPTLALMVTQPLIRGAWLPVNLAPIWQAQTQIEIAKTQVTRLALQYVSQTIALYWDLYYNRSRLEIQKSALQLAEQQLNDTKTMIQAGRLSPLEEFQIKQVVASRQADIILTQDQIQEQEASLRILLNLSKSERILPLDSPQTIADVSSLSHLESKVQQQNPDLLIALAQKKIAQWSADVAQNATLPRLDLQAGVALLGLGNQSSRLTGVTTSPFSRGYETFIDPRRHSFYVGLNLQVYLDTRQVRFRHEQQQVEVQRQQWLIQYLRMQLYNRVRFLHARALRYRLRIPITRVSSELAVKKLQAEQAKYNLGKSTLFAILQFQQDLATAQIAEIGNYVDYQKTVTALYEICGTLLEQHNIVSASPQR